MTYVITHNDSDDFVQNKRLKKILIIPKLNLKCNNIQYSFIFLK